MKNKNEISLKEFIIYVESNVKIKYHGNGYKETVNYCFIDCLSKLKYSNKTKKEKVNIINDLLYYANVLGSDITRDLKKQGINKIIF